MVAVDHGAIGVQVLHLAYHRANADRLTIFRRNSLRTENRFGTSQRTSSEVLRSPVLFGHSHSLHPRDLYVRPSLQQVAKTLFIQPSEIYGKKLSLSRESFPGPTNDFAEKRFQETPHSQVFWLAEQATHCQPVRLHPHLHHDLRSNH